MLMPPWYQTQRDALAVSSVLALQAQRDAAHQICMRSGLPNSKTSFWRYTNLSDWLVEEPAHSHLSLDMPQAILPEAQQLDIGNQGIGIRQASLSDGITCHDLTQDASCWQAVSSLHDLTIHDGMSAMSWALSDGVYCLRIPANTTVSLPVAFMHTLIDQVSQPSTQLRLFIEVGAGSKVTFCESFQGQAHGHWYQVYAQWYLHEDASVRLYQQQCFSGGRCCVHHQVRQAKGSQFDAAILQLGGCHARCVLDLELIGEQAQSNVLGLSQCSAQQRYDFVVRAKHRAKASRSSVQHRALVDERSESAFNAKVLVADTAPGSHAHQSNQNMVLSDRARVHSKPALEIYHDDVVCSHGATVGALSEEAMFFLRSRGIAEQQARAMLTEAFCQLIVDQLWDGDAQDLWHAILLHASSKACQGEACDAI